MNLGNWTPEDVRLIGGTVIGAFGAWLAEGFALLFINIRDFLWSKYRSKQVDKNGSE